MIKFRAPINDRQLVGFGLTPHDLSRLESGEQIIVALTSLELDCNIDVCIFYGEDEKDLYNTLARAGIINEKPVPTEILVAGDDTVH